MELGCDAVMVASAVSRAQDPVAMAGAMRTPCTPDGWPAGRDAFPRRTYATASTPGRAWRTSAELLRSSRSSSSGRAVHS